MKPLSFLLSAVLFSGLPALAGAEEISTFTSVIPADSPTQQGRLSRNGVQQNWLGTEVYPGIINPTVRYNYEAFTFASSLFAGAPYVEISFFDTQSGVNLFSSAYAGGYHPASLSTGWLGDAGASGNYFGTDARYYDVVLPANTDLTLVVNTSSTLGLNDPFTIDVSAYKDTNYSDPVAQVTPEPSTLVTLGTGLIWVAGVRRRRRRGHIEDR